MLVLLLAAHARPRSPSDFPHRRLQKARQRLQLKLRPKLKPRPKLKQKLRLLLKPRPKLQQRPKLKPKPRLLLKPKPRPKLKPRLQLKLPKRRSSPKPSTFLRGWACTITSPPSCQPLLHVPAVASLLAPFLFSPFRKLRAALLTPPAGGRTSPTRC